MEGDKPKTKRFADYAIGYMHIDIAEVRTEEGKLFLFVAIDRTSKLAFAKLETEANRHIASGFLSALIEAVPYQIHVRRQTFWDIWRRERRTALAHLG